nr:ankyrin repeat-containing protein At5g02620-like [Ziziphus jujuba var. spinosa]
MARKTDVEQNKSLLTVENNKKDTALHEAVSYNHSEVVKLLIEEDPDLAFIVNGEGDSPLFMVVDRRFNQVALHILNNAPKCSDQGRNCMKVLEKLQALTLEEDVFGWTPLHYATHIGNDVLVRRFFNKESKSLPFSRNKKKFELLDNNGRIALHIAVESRKVMAVKFLLEQAMAFQDLINLQDKKGNIALHVAATVGDFHIIRILINDSRIDRVATNKDKRTFVDIILSNKELHDTEILKIMVDLKIEIVLPPLFEQKVDTRKTNEAESKEKKKDEIQIEEDEAGCKQKTTEAESKKKKEVEILDT